MGINYYKISEFDEINRNKISIFINEFNGTPFHEVDFNILISHFYDTNLYFLIAEKNDDFVGVCPIHELKSGVLKQSYTSLSSFEVPYGGWIFDSNKISLKLLLSGLKMNILNKLIYSSNIQINGDEYKKNEISNLKINKTVVLDLSPSEEEILAVMKSKQRNKIKRAHKLGITIEEIPFTNIEEFYFLSNELKEKIGKKYTPIILYSKVLEVYSKKGRAICLAAKYKGEFISSMILIANKNFAIAWVAGRRMKIQNNLYQNELLWWESIKWSKKVGSKYLDLCGIDEVNLPHLARLKLSFSKEVIPFYSFSKSSLMFKIVNHFQNKTL